MTFADFITATFAEPRNDSPEPRHRFKDPQALHACITRLLPLCSKYEKCAGLADNLNNAAKPLHALWYAAGSPEAAQAADKVTRVAIDFENFLQLIASVRYAVPAFNDLLHGNDQHFGVFGSSLGQLLRGSLSPRRGGGPNPGKPIVTWDHRGRSPRDRCYALALDHRNAVHDAKALTTRDLMDHVQQVCMAFLFATEENLAVLQEGLFEFREAMNTLIARCSDETKRPAFYLPLTFAPMKKDSKGKYVLDRSAADRVERLETLQRKGHAASGELAVALLGEPGAGKSTVVHKLALQQATAVLKAPFSQVRVPVLLEAKDVTEHRSLLQLVSSQLGCASAEASALAQQGRLLIVLDGLNELPSRLITTAKNELKTLAQEFPTSGFVVTSRGYVSTADLPFWHLRVRDLALSDIRAYVKQVVGDDKEAAQFIADIESVPRLLKMCHTPLLLWMLTEISRETEPGTTNTHHVLRIPENTGRLLREFLSRFLSREQEQGNLCTGDGVSPIDPATVHDVLGYLALKLRERNEVATTQEHCRAFISEQLPSLQSNIGAVDVLNVACHAGILDVSGDDSVRFFHELVQEYFAASESVRRWREGDASLRVLGDAAEWTETKKLFFGLLDPHEQSQLLPRLAETDVAGSAICVMDATQPVARYQEQVVRQATGVLKHKAAGNAIDAYFALSQVWSESARLAVLHAMSGAGGMREFLLQYCDAPLDAAIELVHTSIASHNKAASVASHNKSASVASHNQSASALAALVAIVRQADFTLVQGGPEKVGALLLWAIDTHPEFMGPADIGDHVSVLCSKSAMPTEGVGPSVVCEVISRAFLRGYESLACMLAVSVKAIGLNPSLDAQLCSWCAGAEDGRRVVLPSLLGYLGERSEPNQDLLHLVATRLLVEQQWHSLATALTLLYDRTWLQPLMPSIVDKMLRDGQSMAAVKEVLVAACSPEEMKATMRAALNALAVDRKSLLDAMALVGDDAFTRDRLVAYFSHYVFKSRYNDARITLAMIDGLGLDHEWSNKMVEHLITVDNVWLATDLAVKAPGASRRDELLHRACGDVEAWLRGASDASVLRHACRPWWHYLQPDVRFRILDKVLAGQHDERIVDGWCPDAVSALADRLKVAQMQGHSLAINESLFLKLKAMQRGEAAPQMQGTDAGDSAPLSRRALRRQSLQHNSDPEGLASTQHILEFDHNMRHGNLDAAIKMIATCNKMVLAPKAADWISILLNPPNPSTSDAVAAGRLLVAFDLTSDFLPECEKLMPVLLADDRPGIAGALAEAVGAECKRNFTALLLESFEEALFNGTLDRAESLATQSRTRLLDDEFAARIRTRLRRAIERRDGTLLQDFMRCPRLMSLLDWKSIRSAMIDLRVPVDGKVTRTGAGFVMVDLLFVGGWAGRGYLSSSHLQPAIAALRVGDKCVVTLSPSTKHPDRPNYFNAILAGGDSRANSTARHDHATALAVATSTSNATHAQKGQTRYGTLCVHDGRISALFDGDDRDVVIVNEGKVPSGAAAAGRRACFYILSANKRSGVEVRFEKLCELGRER